MGFGRPAGNCIGVFLYSIGMTDIELKTLKDNLWHSADMLRAGAHLAANKYGQPILGLIFLRYADVLFKQHKDEIDEEYNRYKGSRMEREYKDVAVEKCGFYLPECAYQAHLMKLHLADYQ